MLQEPGSYIGEVVKMMSQKKVLVKVSKNVHDVCARCHAKLPVAVCTLAATR